MGFAVSCVGDLGNDCFGGVFEEVRMSQTDGMDVQG